MPCDGFDVQEYMASLDRWLHVRTCRGFVDADAHRLHLNAMYLAGNPSYEGPSPFRVVRHGTDVEVVAHHDEKTGEVTPKEVAE